MIDFQPQYVPIQYGYSPLYFAIEAAQMDCLSLLLTRGADVNMLDKVLYHKIIVNYYYVVKMFSGVVVFTSVAFLVWKNCIALYD